MSLFFFFFFFNDTATTEIYTLSLHDALPIWFAAYVARCAARVRHVLDHGWGSAAALVAEDSRFGIHARAGERSEEHTSELQSPCNLVCRLLLEKKKNRWTRCVSERNIHTFAP